MAEQLRLNIVLLTCVMLYNFGYLIMELFNEEPYHFDTFIYMVRRAIPSDISALQNGKVPHMSPYEVKILVCGLSRAFFGKPNSINIPREADN